MTVNKLQVFALSLIRRKFAKNPADLIRCKFSIDDGVHQQSCVYLFETICPLRWKPGIHHPDRMSGLAAFEKAAEITSLAGSRCALAFA